MDPVTQGLFGALWAQAASRRSSVRAAALVGAAAGMAPDLDVLIRSPADDLVALEFHRHFTHAIVFVPIGALVVALIAWPLLKRLHDPPSFARAWTWALLGMASHGLLDAATSYGTRLLWPMSDARLAANIISVVDPFFTVPLALLLGLALWRRRRRWAAVAAGWSALLLLFGTLQSWRAERVVADWADAQGLQPERVLARPSLGNLWLWRGLVDTGESYRAVAVRILPGTPVRTWPGERVEALEPRDAPAGRIRRDLERFDDFSAGWLFRFAPYERGGEWFVGDFRYAIDPASDRPLWGLRVDPDEPGRRAVFERPAEVRDDERAAFLARLAGRDPGTDD
ncbi:MAG: metal-dependent hydrolase [Wenzhouxiangellaceae bacterium]|nr:metal-dependent hydrolase [Wenzhouxiangellaceae bacterium]